MKSRQTGRLSDSGIGRPRLGPFRLAVTGLLLLLTCPLMLSTSAAAAQETTPQAASDFQSLQTSRPLAGSAGENVKLIVGYCTLIVAASLAGGWLPGAVELTHTRMQVLVSTVGGLMLGIAVFHLLPHSIEETGAPVTSVNWMMGGLLTMFFLVRMFHFHHHGEATQKDIQACCDAVPAEPAATSPNVVQIASAAPGVPDAASAAERSGSHAHHSHGAGEHSHHGAGHVHRLSWAGVAVGLALHTLIDGLALGASVESAAVHPTAGSLPGLGTFLAILLHKPLDAVSITSLMMSGGWSARSRNLVNAGFALMCPLGAILFSLGVRELSGSQHLIIGAALGFSAGVFLCISLGDLLPELELHSHNRLKLSMALLLGVAIAWGVEQTHRHPHPGNAGTAVEGSTSGEATGP